MATRNRALPGSSSLSNPPTQPVALSIRQPWAALLAAGVKTIEIRRWPTVRRGRVLIHAARVPDDRPAAWRVVPPDIEPLTQLRGGIIGSAELIACTHYRDQNSFQVDQSLHCNEPGWFEESGLYGF